MSKPPIVFLHGLYMNVSSWEPWLARAKQAGFDARAIEWPGHAGKPADLRANPPAELGALTFSDVLAPVRADILARGDNPLIVGHSIGGLQVQKLLSEGIGRAGVAITPAPPQGVFSLAPEFFRANLGHVNPFPRRRPVRMTPDRFFYTFGNASPRAESDAAYEKWCVHESRNIPISTLGRQGRVEFAAVKQPLLIFGAEFDHLIPASLARRIAGRYRKAGVNVEYRDVEGKSHLVCNQTGWEALADEVFAWAEKNGSGKA